MKRREFLKTTTATAASAASLLLLPSGAGRAKRAGQ